MEDGKVIFDVRGMTCDNCVQHVTKAAQGVSGVREVRVSLAARTAEVEGASSRNR
jgi:copper chaperone CopZ